MTHGYSIAELRRRLAHLVRDAERGDSVQITRRGKPVAVLMGLRTYRQLAAGPRGFAATYNELVRDVRLAALDIDPDEVFGSARDRTPGRPVEL